MAQGAPLPFRWLLALLGVALAFAIVARAPWSGDPSPAAGRSPEPSGTPPGSAFTPRPCRLADRPTRPRGYEDWAITLVDTEFRLPPRYEPPDLVSTTEAGFPSDFPIREVVIEDLRALREAAADEGLLLDVTFGYRSYALQRQVFEAWLDRRSEEHVLATVARPGHSEHQLGTTLDFTTAGAGAPTKAWGSSPEGAWMAEHAHEFGFVMTYPEGSKRTSCYAHEPWHFRYVGRGLAAEVLESGMTLRSYLLCQRERHDACATLGPA